MPGFCSRTVAGLVVLLRLAAAGTVNPLSLDVSTCSDNTVTVPTTLSGFAAASSHVVEALPTYVSNPLNCGYYTCFEQAMNAWSAWEFGSMGPATTSSGSPKASSTTGTPSRSRPTSSSQPKTSTSNSSTSPATTTPANQPRGMVDLEQFPFRSAVSSCCGLCGVWAGDAQLLWWPSKTADARKEAAYSTTVYQGTTLTSPTVYFAITGPFAINSCGSSATGPSAAILAVPTSDIKRILTPVDGPEPLFRRPTAILTPSDFSGCSTATVGQYNLTQTVDGSAVYGDRCFPVLQIPTQVVALEPAWSECVPAVFGVSDPPIALTPATNGPLPGPTATFPAAPTVPPPPPPPPPPAPPAEPDSTSAAPSAPAAPQPPSAPTPPPAPPPPPPAPTPTVLHAGSRSFTLNVVTTTDKHGATQTAMGLVVAGTTLMAGAAAITQSGTQISLGSSMLVVGSDSATYDPAPAPTSVHLGAVIMSGLGFSGSPDEAQGTAAPSGAAVSINEATPSSGSGSPAMPTIATGQADRSSRTGAAALLAALALVGVALL